MHVIRHLIKTAERIADTDKSKSMESTMIYMPMGNNPWVFYFKCIHKVKSGSKPDFNMII